MDTDGKEASFCFLMPVEASPRFLCNSPTTGKLDAGNLTGENQASLNYGAVTRFCNVLIRNPQLTIAADLKRAIRVNALRSIGHNAHAVGTPLRPSSVCGFTASLY